jgi:hypothetical protein
MICKNTWYYSLLSLFFTQVMYGNNLTRNFFGYTTFTIAISMNYFTFFEYMKI